MTAQFIAREEVDLERHKDHTDALNRAIGSLAPKERDVMCELVKDNNLARAGDKLKLNFRTVKRRRDKAIANLRELLA